MDADALKLAIENDLSLLGGIIGAAETAEYVANIARRMREELDEDA